MKVIAHRGYSGAYPENTMLAFQKAVEAGSDMIELDVHLTKDSRLVVIHDETVDRTTDGTGSVKDLTFAELQEFNAAKCWGGKFGPQRIPSFEEYCEWAHDAGAYTNIEIKTDHTYYPGIEERIWETILRYGVQDNVMFSSFNHLSLQKINRIAGGVDCGALIWWEAGVKVFPGHYCREAGFTCYHAAIESLDEEMVADCKRHQIQLNIWTVNDMAGLEKLHAWDCEGIITNYPGVAKAWLAAQSGS